MKCRTGCEKCFSNDGLICETCQKENGVEVYNLQNGKCVRKSQSEIDSLNGTGTKTSGSTSSKIPIAAIAGGGAGLIVLIAIIVIAVKCCKSKP